MRKKILSTICEINKTNEKPINNNIIKKNWKPIKKNWKKFIKNLKEELQGLLTANRRKPSCDWKKKKKKEKRKLEN